jgi:hypothetical protein
MSYRLSSVLLKSFGTLVLAGAFVWMVGRAPFLPDLSRENAATGNNAQSSYLLRNLNINSGSAPAGPPQWSALPPAAVTAGLEPAMGLFKARFAGDEPGSGFATEEHRVPGECAGAGYRYIRNTCPDCQIINKPLSDKAQPMLMWTDANVAKGGIKSVSTDCVSIGPDGVPVVGTLSFGDGAVDLSAQSNDIAADIVPLIPGSSRIAAVEIGGWLATFDEVARPSTALHDMTAHLLGQGWREAPQSEEPGYRPAFVGERVFTNRQNAFCVISISKQGDSYQVLTVVSSHM